MPLQTVVDAEALSLSCRHHVRVRIRDVAQQYLDEAWRAGGDDKRLVLPRQLKVVHVHQRLLLWEFRRVSRTRRRVLDVMSTVSRRQEERRAKQNDLHAESA